MAAGVFRDRGGVMVSQRITWEMCPRCGRPAAVGWLPAVGIGGDPIGEDPVEFDCVAGCQLSSSGIAAAFGTHRGTPLWCRGASAGGEVAAE
jgi:hypothetical protein